MMSRRPAFNNNGNVPSNILYVGSIPFDWDEATLKSVVSGSGRILDVRLGFDYAGKNKGFCFIEYENPQEAQKAVHLLGQVKIMQSGARSGQYKKLRIEVSKEGFRANSAENKQVLDLDKRYLPNNVQLPAEMGGGGSGASQFQFQGAFQQSPHPSTNSSNLTTSPLPEKHTQATRNLPQVQKLPFTTPDKINETLSQIPPPQLFELIANLKNILNGPNAARAGDVFQLSPQLATATAQALLLMGFIDSDVIAESMKSASSTPVPQPPIQQPQPIPQNYVPNAYGQVRPPQPSMPVPGPPSVSMAPTQPQQQQNLQQPQQAYGQPIPPQNVANFPPNLTSNPTWNHLPAHTKAKLAAVPPDQAEVILQVLSLPADQISALPLSSQTMVTDIRAQYL